MNSEQILARLVGYDTTSTRSNLELIDFARNLLDDHGIASRLVSAEDGTRANLYATVGPDEVGGVMLSGHTDVVPTAGQQWRGDPYRLRDGDDGRLYGRGSCDMKGFIACALAALPRIAAAPLRTPIHFALSYDEEIGCVGARRLAAALEDAAVKPRVALVGEPTGMNLVLGHKGKLSLRVTVIGSSCHSARIDRGVNAVEYAAELVAFIRAMNRRAAEQVRDARYAVPHSSFHVGNIEGGGALNIVPDSCRFEFEIRNLPQQDLHALAREIRGYASATLLPEMRARHPGSDIRFAETASYPGLDTDPASLAVACARAVNPAGAIGEHASFGTEAGLFDGIGIDSLVCGPGDIAQAHRADEFVERAQLRACDDMLANLVRRCRDSANFV